MTKPGQHRDTGTLAFRIVIRLHCGRTGHFGQAVIAMARMLYATAMMHHKDPV